MTEKEKNFKEHVEDFINVKLLFFRMLKNWPWFLATMLLGLFLAHEYNKRKPNIYKLDTLISVKDRQNPFFTTNMSLVFNWGGPSDKVNTIMTTFKSRNHNEQIVKKLKLYIDYYIEGKYFPVDIYGKAPFIVQPDEKQYQITGLPFAIRIVSPDTFTLSYQTEDSLFTAWNYHDEQTRKIQLKNKTFKKNYRFGEHIDEDFFHGTIILNPKAEAKKNKIYFFKFLNFNSVVNHFRHLFVQNVKGTSMIRLSMKGVNKKKLEKFLNTSVSELKDKLLEDKNSFAINTLKFIDSTLKFIRKDLDASGKKLEAFQKGKVEFALDNPSANLYSQLIELDQTKNQLSTKKMYYQTLLNTIRNNHLDRIPAPSVVGIEDPLIVDKVKQITSLSIQKKQLEATLSPDAIPVQELNLKIEELKSALETAVHSALYNLNRQMQFLQSQINALENKLNKLPSELKNFIDLKRDYKIKDEIYSYLLQKRNEVNIVKASNQSTIKVLDNAKDTGQSPIAPNRQANYLLFLMIALLLPALWILIKTVTDETIYAEEEIKRLTPIRLIGTIFHSHNNEKLPVLNDKSGTQIRESFSTLRTNIRFTLPAKNKAKTIIITSTTSGEGKTFISSNLAAINASGGQKTVLLEFDIRKPKTYRYFKLKSNGTGISDFLLKTDMQPQDIIKETFVKNLYFIPAGSSIQNFKDDIAGLIESDRVHHLFDYLMQEFDYIIVDSPPLGLVPDSIILNQYADFMGYVIRENYSKKSYLNLVNEYHENKTIDNIGIIYNDYRINLLKRYAYHSRYAYAYGREGYKAYSFTNRKTFKEKFKEFFHRFFSSES